MSDDNDLTRTSGATSTAHTAASGWLTSSGSIDHGRFAPGAVIAERYRVIGLLGRGGMGEVYRADDLRLGQQVALKFLPHALATDARRLAQFHNEVRTARQVSHPNVCRVYDIGELKTGTESQLFITMEYVDGEDLSVLQRRIGRLPEERAVEIARQIAAGLAAAHERGILHRDLKPANIMLDGAGKVRIMDFSLAAAGAVDDIRAGTPAYMAPEQLEGREVSPRSDIYALGLVLYELFTGRRAFDAKTLADLVAQQQSGSVTSPTEIVPSLDPAIERAIVRCLDLDPSRRPVSALAVAASLPGGDPLAAALAAGETPSPEMVAAAGGVHAALSPRAALAWIGLVVAALMGVLLLSEPISLIARTHANKSPDVLVDHAEQFRQALGYTDPATNRAWQFGTDTDFINWTVKQGDGLRRWPLLSALQPGAYHFWYRTSPQPMVPYDDNSPVTLSDPPLQLTGMTSVRVDLDGRLRSFEAVPPQVETPAMAAASVDWPKVFALAGLDVGAFTPIDPTWTPRGYADDRRAWRGALPGTALPVRVEAASYRGRATYFDIIGDWTRPARQQPPADVASRLVTVMSNLVIWSLVIGAALLARRNLRSGRADRRGSFHLAAAVFVIFGAAWLLSPHASDSSAELNRFFTGMGMALMQAGFLYLIYLALEPFVRKSLPMMLVSWSRLTSGRVRDPLVGRDVLIGIAAGVLLTLISFAYNYIPPMIGRAEPMLNLNVPTLITMVSGRMLANQLIVNIDWALQNAMMTTMLLALMMNRLKRPWLASAITLSIMVLMWNRSIAVESGYLWLEYLFAFVMAAMVLAVLRRFGLLASVVMSYANNVTNAFVLTGDSSRMYFPSSLVVLAVMALLAVAGVWLARADAPLFSERQ